MIKLKRLKILRYRDVEPCELVFSDRFNILLGANGAGKTTLLNLISKVLRTNLADPSDPFSIEVELAFDGGVLTGAIHSSEDGRTVQPELPPEMQGMLAARSGASQVAQWPELSFQWIDQDPSSTIWFRRTGDKITMSRDGDPRVLAYEFRTFEHVLSKGLLASLTLLASPLSGKPGMELSDFTNASRFDESLDAFRAITARQQDNATVMIPDFRPLIVGTASSGKKETRSGLQEAFPTEGMIPASMLRSIKDRFVDGATDVSFQHDDLPFLGETVRLLALRLATAKLELIRKVAVVDGADLLVWGNLAFWFTRKDGSIFQDQHLSYGQKRLLSFLYYLDCNPSFVIADELVNGLHHAWIDECMKAIGDRQAFLTSQNPLLLDYLWFESVQEVKASFIVCRTEAVGDREKMIWRNLTDDEAEMFYSAYKVGIEHVGEILRTRGLW